VVAQCDAVGVLLIGVDDFHLNIWVALVDDAGELLMEETYGVGGKQDDEAVVVEQTADSGFVMITRLRNAYRIYKLDKNLQLEWEFNPMIGRDRTDAAHIYGLTPCGDGTFLFCGTARFGTPSADIWIGKIGPKPGSGTTRTRPLPALQTHHPASRATRPTAYTIIGRRIDPRRTANRTAVYIVKEPPGLDVRARW
jgi:hypothetical protein